MNSDEEDISNQGDLDFDHDDDTDMAQTGVFDVAVPGEIDDSSDSEHAIAGHGRPEKTSWGHLTDQDKPFRHSSSTCKHCDSTVKHNKKVSKMIGGDFSRQVLDMEESAAENPDHEFWI